MCFVLSTSFHPESTFYPSGRSKYPKHCILFSQRVSIPKVPFTLVGVRSIQNITFCLVKEFPSRKKTILFFYYKRRVRIFSPRVLCIVLIRINSNITKLFCYNIVRSYFSLPYGFNFLMKHQFRYSYDFTIFVKIYKIYLLIYIIGGLCSYFNRDSCLSLIQKTLPVLTNTLYQTQDYRQVELQITLYT